MVRVVSLVWNIHCTIPIPYIGIPCAMTPKVLGSGRGVMGPTKSQIDVKTCTGIKDDGQ